MGTIQITNENLSCFCNTVYWQTVLAGYLIFLKRVLLTSWLTMALTSGWGIREEIDIPGRINICHHVVWTFGSGRKYLNYIVVAIFHQSISSCWSIDFLPPEFGNFLYAWPLRCRFQLFVQSETNMTYDWVQEVFHFRFFNLLIVHEQHCISP